MKRSIVQPGRIAASRVVLWVALVLACSLLIMMFGVLNAFDTAIEPEMEKRSRLIGSTVRDGLERALQLGVPLEAVAGSNQFLANVMADFEDLQSITLLDRSGQVIASETQSVTDRPTLMTRFSHVGISQVSQYSFPLLNRNTLVGEIQITFDPAFVSTRLRDVVLDVFVVGLVSVLLAFELVAFVMASSLGKPLDRIFSLLRLQAQGDFSQIIPVADAGQLRRVARRISDRALDLAARAAESVMPERMPQAYFVDIRVALFVFSLATEISGAFLPLYARDVGGPAWMTGEFAATAPLIAYLAAIALVAPFGGILTRAASPRALFLGAIPATAVAMVGVGLAQSALTIALWHGFMALAYAVATIACQEYSIRTAPEGEDAKAIGSYIFVILGGAFSGIALGSVLADRIGASGTFFFGAVLTMLAGLLGALTMSGKVEPREKTVPAASAKNSGGGLGILLNIRFLSLVLGVGATLNIGMSVFVWYLTPVILAEAGSRIADIGRVVMLFYFVPVLAGPAIARLADGLVGYVPMLIGGALLSGCALTSLAVWSGFWPMVTVIALFGFGYAMCDATSYAQTIRLSEESGLAGARDAGLGALRLIKRLAAIVGLLASAWLANSFDYLTLSVLIGLLMVAGAFVLITGEVVGALLRKGQMENS